MGGSEAEDSKWLKSLDLSQCATLVSVSSVCIKRLREHVSDINLVWCAFLLSYSQRYKQSVSPTHPWSPLIHCRLLCSASDGPARHSTHYMSSSLHRQCVQHKQTSNPAMQTVRSRYTNTRHMLC